MSVQFILGRSGTGKTSYCIKAIVDALLEPSDNQPLIFLVPEQATYQAERAILNDKRVAGYSRLNVLSFARLQFLLLGKDTARPGLSRIGQQMIIHRILRENSRELKVFGSSASWPGLGRQMAGAITELHQYGKTADDIDRLIGELQKDERNNLAVLKFSDISLVLKEYLKFIEGKFIDPDVQLNQSCGAVAEAGFVRGAKLWVDGFAGFTTAELAVLAELLKAAADAQIALCLDPSKLDLARPDAQALDAVSIFGPTERTYVALVDIIKKMRLRLVEPIILDEAVRFSSCRELAHIERDMFKLEPTRIPVEDNVRVISAPSARAEVQFVAREILQLVRRKNYRYRDIAVIASDIDRYQHYVKACFDDCGIAFFIDKRKPLNQHAAVGLICSALQAVTGGFCHSDVFAYLKSDLVPVERCPAPIGCESSHTKTAAAKSLLVRDNRCGIDLLENYCLAFGIGGRDWMSGRDWDFAGQEDVRFDEQRINEIRLKVSGPLLELREKLLGGSDAARTISSREFTRIIFDFLETLGVRERIGSWIEEAVEQKDYATVDEHRQFYDKLLNIFDELVEVFGGQEMACADWLAIINSAFSQLTLAFIPPTLDQVLVGSIERSRHPDLKAVFLIGATQKQFPVPVSFDSILSDAEREACESADFALAATAGQKLAERQYLAYIAFTRPSEFLCVTYPSVDEKGSAVARSQFIAELESLFENLTEESIAGEQINIENVHNKSELADLLCSQLGRDALRDPWLVTRGSVGVFRDGLSELLNDICADEELAEVGSKVVSAINYDNRAQLDKRIVEKFFGEQIRSSATRLSTFAACPYRYFARYILELEEREEFKFEPLELGVFYHRVLDALLKELNAERKDFATIQDEELLELLRKQILKLVQEDSFISHFVRHSVHNAFIIHSAGEVLEDCVSAIAQMVRAGSFRPMMSEVSFGEVKNSSDRVGEYRIGLSGGRVLFLDGKIDRLDVAELNDKKIAIVFDYKRRDKTFSWSKFYHGLDIQLPIYMLAVRNACNSQCEAINPVGAFYMPVEVSPAIAAIDELAERGEKFRYKAKGIFNGEFARQLDSTASKDSEFYNFYVTKDGEPYGRYNMLGALRPEDFEKVLEFTERKIIGLAEEIVSGEIEVKPYRVGTEIPCSYCVYKSVCRFDWQINDYNFLEAFGKTRVLEGIGDSEIQNSKVKKAK